MTRPLLACLLPAILVCFACGGSPPPNPGAPASGSPAPAPAPVAKIVPVPVTTPDPGLDLVHQATQDFYAGDLTKLHDRFSPELAQELTLERLIELRRRVGEQYGKEIAVLGEESQVKDPYRGYVRWAKFDKYDGPMEVQWVLRKDDKIASFYIRPAKRKPPEPNPGKK